MNLAFLKVVRDWGQAKETLLAIPKTKIVQRGKKPLNPATETKLVEWIIEQRKSGYIVTMLHNQQKALKLSTIPSFKASTGWVQRFMKRHDLVLRQKTKISQKLPDDFEEEVLSFQKYVIQLRKEHQFRLCHIGNMDETPMCFDMPPNQTRDQKGTM